ncbi:hypothetical protein PIB30_001674 [Stylosanthes scabra]|uniref:Uncharacterized protein n=1 Tax=Stylosanthes scabra TaxID=79078 RepID=A0ABU6T2K3_9FABA|nr:hypothetical protein [Stylosanthes scabra]
MATEERDSTLPHSAEIEPMVERAGAQRIATEELQRRRRISSIITSKRILLDMDNNEQLNEEIEMDMKMDSGFEGEKSRASNYVSGSLEGEKPPCQAKDSAEPATTECGFEVTKIVAIPEEVKGANDDIGSLLASLKGEGNPTRNSVVDGRCAKRARIAVANCSCRRSDR